jgi:hypothetical protein
MTEEVAKLLAFLVSSVAPQYGDRTDYFAQVHFIRLKVAETSEVVEKFPFVQWDSANAAFKVSQALVW